MVAVSLIAARSLIGLGDLAGPALLPAHERLGELWQAAIQPIAGAPEPDQSAVAGAGRARARPCWPVSRNGSARLLVCGVVPLALLAAYPVVRRVINDRRLRLWVAGTYALLPVLLGGTNQGRLALSVVAIGLPLLVPAVRALVLRRVHTPEAWRGGWGCRGGAGRAGRVRAVLDHPGGCWSAWSGWSCCGVRPARSAGSASPSGCRCWSCCRGGRVIIAEPGRMFVGPDAALGGAPAAPPVWELFLGRGLGAGLPPLWVGAVIFGDALGGRDRRAGPSAGAARGGDPPGSPR